jgi:hypothetical protein
LTFDVSAPVTILMMVNLGYLPLYFYLFFAVGQAGQIPDDTNMSTSLVPIYEPWLSNVPGTSFDFNPALGGRNTGKCCQMAVNESLFIQDGALRLRPGQTFYRGSLSTLELYPTFPCATTFNGSLIAPPQDFWTPYTWCEENCAGWSVTKNHDLEGWLKPLVAWILPALVFSLSIPRRRRIDLPMFIFKTNLHIGGLLLMPAKIVMASLIVTVDTLVWLGILFAMAGPICLSLAYEAILDAKLLTYLEAQIESSRFTVNERAHLLLVLLLGNLDTSPADVDMQNFLHILPDDIPWASASFNSNSVNDDVANGVQAQPVSIVHVSTPLANSPTRTRDINIMKTKLIAILDSQPTFGVTVGAPALFYVGSFVWACFEIRSNWGSYFTAHQLALGMFWMIVPHISILYGLLLAGNNPSAWEGIVSYQAVTVTSGLATQASSQNSASSSSHSKRRKQSLSFQAFSSSLRWHGFWRPSSNSKYSAVWLWHRGHSKAIWIAKTIEEHSPYMESACRNILGHRFGGNLWWSVLSAFLILLVPVFCGMLVSYMTPQTGLGCRSVMMLIYFLSQCSLLILYMWDVIVKWPICGENLAVNTRSVKDSRGLLIIWNICFAICIGFATLCSIGGTLFTLNGLYNNCLCAIPVSQTYQ